VQPKLATIDAALDLCPPGAALALGGATLRRKPMTLVRALAERKPSGLRLWTWLGSLDVDVLVAAGAVAEVNSAYVGFGPLGLPPATRRAFADGSVVFHDYSESSFIASVRAGGQGLPFAITRALLGTSLADDVAVDIPSPHGGPPVQAVPAARPDVAFLHAHSADEFGNVRRRRPNATDDIDLLIAAAARHVVVSVEQIDAHADIVRNRDEVILPAHHVTAVVHAPRGAHPTGCDGFYDADFDALTAYVEQAGA
jgi:glutaconate CoA-transferase subunit A